MQDSQHTPGPWHINHWSKGNSGVSCGRSEDGIRYFTGEAVNEAIFGIRAGTEHLGRSRTYGSFEGCHIADLPISYGGLEEAKANARLIAAAPDMLEDHQTDIAIIEDLIYNIRQGIAADTICYTLENLLVSKRAIIAKALPPQ
jgi:hypothetical protein